MFVFIKSSLLPITFDALVTEMSDTNKGPPKPSPWSLTLDFYCFAVKPQPRGPRPSGQNQTSLCFFFEWRSFCHMRLPSTLCEHFWVRPLSLKQRQVSGNTGNDCRHLWEPNWENPRFLTDIWSAVRDFWASFEGGNLTRWVPLHLMWCGPSFIAGDMKASQIDLEFAPQIWKKVSWRSSFYHQFFAILFLPWQINHLKVNQV